MIQDKMYHKKLKFRVISINLPIIKIEGKLI